MQRVLGTGWLWVCWMMQRQGLRQGPAGGTWLLRALRLPVVHGLRHHQEPLSAGVGHELRHHWVQLLVWLLLLLLPHQGSRAPGCRRGVDLVRTGGPCWLAAAGCCIANLLAR